MSVEAHKAVQAAWKALETANMFSVDLEEFDDRLYENGKKALGKEKIWFLIQGLLMGAMDAKDIVMQVAYWGTQHSQEEPIGHARMKLGQIGLANGLEFDSNGHHHFRLTITGSTMGPISKKAWNEWKKEHPE